jgi:hypothetical protein
MGDQPGSYFWVHTSEDKVYRKEGHTTKASRLHPVPLLNLDPSRVFRSCFHYHICETSSDVLVHI